VANTHRVVSRYAPHVCFDSSAYVPYLQRIVKIRRFDLPPNIEQNAAHWKLVSQRIDYWITQKRAAIKKAVSNLYFSCSYAMLITLSGGS
jgi:hypothetical protein